MRRCSGTWALLACLPISLMSPSWILAQTDASILPDSALYPFNPGLFWTDLGLTVVYDTNFELTQLPLAGPGFLADVRAQLRTSTYRPLIRIEYRGQMRQFKASEEWNRDTHSLLGVLEQRLGPLGVEMIGSWQMNNQTEDREIADVYSVSPRMSLRLGSTRLRGYWRFWTRLFEQGSEEEETIRTLGGDFRWRSFGFMEWRVGYRHEEGDSNSPSRRFVRQSVSAGCRLDLTSRTALVLDASRRERTYPDREVEVSGVDVSTQDVRWIPGIYIRQGSSLGPELRVGYEYQVRASNDPRREYDAHRAVLGFRVPLFNWDRQPES